MLAQRLLFSDTKILRDIPTGSPPTVAPNRGGVGSNGDFQPFSHYVSETVQDRDIVIMEH